MNNKIKQIVVAAGLLTAVSTNAYSFGLDDCNWGITPYIGLDAQIRTLHFQEGLGGETFSDNYPQGNVYVGAKFCDYLGLEFGYEQTIKRSAEKQFNAADFAFGNSVFGVTVPTDLTVVGANTVAEHKIGGWHLDLLGFAPICSDIGLEAFGLVGVARLNQSLKANFLGYNGLILGQPDSVFTGSRKYILRLGAGLQQMLNCNLGVRAGVIWENTQKMPTMRTTFAQFARSDTGIAKTKNSWIYSFGVFWQFS